MSELPQNYWRDKKLLQAQVKKHGTLTAVANANASPNVRTLWAWWSRHGLPPLPAGPKAAAKAKPAEPGSPVSNEEILRERIKELERHDRRDRAGEVREERLLRRLERAIATLEPRFKPPRALSTETTTPQEMVLFFSDTHGSEVVKPEQVLGMNEYNWDVMLERMAHIQRSVLSHKEHISAPIKKLHLWMLGDMLSGDIHEELSNTNDRPGAEAAIQFAYDTAAWIEGFVPHFEEISVAGVPGNHPRKSQKPSAKDAHNNGDWIAYKMIEGLLRDYPSIEFDFPHSSYATRIVADRWRWLLMHGDGIRSTMPGVPWGGVVRRITTLEQQFSAAKMPLDYVCLGHFHTANSLDGVGVQTFLNGSVKGLDEYSLKQFGSGRRASQRLVTVHPKHGVTGEFRIDLQKSLPAADPTA